MVEGCVMDGWMCDGAAQVMAARDSRMTGDPADLLLIRC